MGRFRSLFFYANHDHGSPIIALLERRPAPVFFVAASPLRARVIQQPLANIFPERVGASQAHGIGRLNFDGATAAAA